MLPDDKESVAVHSYEDLVEELKEQGYEEVEADKPPVTGVYTTDLAVQAAYDFNEYRRGDRMLVNDNACNRALIASGNFILESE